MMRWVGMGAIVIALGCGDDGSGATADATTAGPTGTQTESATDAASSGPAPGSSSGDATTGGADSSGGGSDSTTGGVSEPGPLVVYANDGQSTIHLLSADDAGTLTPVTTYDMGAGAAELALHPDGLHLYATGNGGAMGPRIHAYAIDPVDGQLTELGVTPVTISPVYLAIDPTGQVAMMADFGGDAIETYAVGDDFVVEPGATHAQATGDEPHSILTDPSGQYVYVPHRGSNDIWQFALDASTGGLTPLDPPTVDAAPGAGARHLAFHPSGEHAYLSDEFSDTITHFSRDPATGQLTRAESVTSLPAGFDGDLNTTADVHVSPDGAYAYLSNRGHDSIAVYELDAATGEVTALGQTPTEPRPREFDVEPAGGFLYAAGQDSGQLAGYAIDPASGSLTAIGTWAIGGSPLWALGVRLPAR